MGLGLGGIVDKSSGGGALAGATYLGFIAPGLLASTAMQTASGEAMYPIIAGFKWVRTFHAMAATPSQSAGIVFGQIGFLLFRIGLVSAILAVVIGLFGVGGALAGSSSRSGRRSSPGSRSRRRSRPLWSASRDSPQSFSTIVRFVVTPMFLFSGTFFPVDRLPPLLQPSPRDAALSRGRPGARRRPRARSTASAAVRHVAFLVVLAPSAASSCSRARSRDGSSA